MPTEAKRAAVAALKEELSAAKATIVADYRGLTVADISAVRRALRGDGIKYRVVKNRLAKIAAQEAGNTELTGLLEGPSALAMGGGDEVALAKSFLDAIRPYRTVAIRGAVLSGRRVDADSVARLATLPSREVMLGQLAGGIVAPIASLASLLAAPLRNLGHALSQLAAQKEAAAPAAPPKAEPPQSAALTAGAVAVETGAPAAEAAAEAVADTQAADVQTAPEALAGEALAESPDVPAEAVAESPDEPVADAEPATESSSSETTD